MNICLKADRVELRPHQILRIDRPEGMRIVCLRGALWVTQHGDLRDNFVPAGASFGLDRGGVALVSALDASSVWLEAPVRLPSRSRPAVGAVLGRWLQRLRAVGRRPAIELHGY